MPDSKLEEGFILLNPKKISKELAREVKHYNHLVSRYDKSPQQKQAIINSEDKIRHLMFHKNIYPIHIVYGHKILISLLQEPEIDVSKFILELNSCRNTYGETYFEDLLLFKPTDLPIQDSLGWSYGNISSFDLHGTQNNIFMLAVSSGNTELVSSILKLIPDKNLQKKILSQALQYWHDDKLLCKPILHLAIESGSADLLKFIMETMNVLGILKDEAQNYQGLMASDNQYHNLLSTVASLADTSMVEVVLQYQSSLGRLFYLFSDKHYPSYINTEMTFIPVFIKPMVDHSVKVFDQIFEATFKAFNISSDDDYWVANYKIKALASALALIDLNLYVTHSDFNTHIFKRILSAKVNLDKQLQDLSLMQKKYCSKNNIPFPTTEQGEYIELMQARLMLLTGNCAVDIVNFHKQLNLKKILGNLYEHAITANNFNAAAVVLLEFYNKGYTDAFDLSIENLTGSNKNQLCNYLLSQAVNQQNSYLMDLLLKHQFKLDPSPFHAVTRFRKNPDTLVFVAQELVHRLVESKFEYQSAHIQIILSELLRIVRHKESDKSVNQAVLSLIEDIKEYQKNISKGFTFLSPTNIDLSSLIIEIEQAISNEKNLNR